MKGTSNNLRMRLAMSYFGFRRGESKEHSLSYVIEIQRSMNFKRALEPEPWLRHPVREWVVRGAHKFIQTNLRIFFKRLGNCMSRSYIAGATAQMPQTKIVFDRYHIEQKMNSNIYVKYLYDNWRRKIIKPKLA